MTLKEAMATLWNVDRQLRYAAKLAKTDEVVEKLAVLREAVEGNWSLWLCLAYAIEAAKRGDSSELARVIDICWGYLAAMDDVRRNMFNPLP
jgi:hypothetical protein